MAINSDSFCGESRVLFSVLFLCLFCFSAPPAESFYFCRCSIVYYYTFVILCSRIILIISMFRNVRRENTLREVENEELFRYMILTEMLFLRS